MWTFIKGTALQSSSECRMKSRFPADVTLKTAVKVIKDDQVVVTGYIKSRATSREIEVLESNKIYIRD